MKAYVLFAIVIFGTNIGNANTTNLSENQIYQAMEQNSPKKHTLQEILNSLQAEALLPESESTEKPFNPRKNIDIVANSSKEYVGSCIRDVLDGGAAAGGAIIGSALGGASWDIAEVKRKKFDVVVNSGPRKWQGN